MHYPTYPPEAPTLPQAPSSPPPHRTLGMGMAFAGALVVLAALAISLASTVSGARMLAYPMPNVRIAYDASGSQPRIGVPIHFQAQTQAGTNLTYSWRFGDGSTATGQTPSHTFQKYGQMVVALTVRDPLSQTTTVQATVSILPPKPSACFHFHQGAGLTVTFDGSCSTGTQLHYSWNFGDTSTDGQAGTATMAHTYATPGTYTARLQVTDTAHQTATTSASVTVTIPAPTASFTWVAGPFPSASIVFDASASTGAQLTYSWDYGDGQSDPNAGPQTSHYYGVPGTFTVTLTVTDAFGRSATSHQTVTVSGF